MHFDNFPNLFPINIMLNKLLNSIDIYFLILLKKEDFPKFPPAEWVTTTH